MDVRVEGVGSDAEAVGEATHGQGPWALLLEQMRASLMISSRVSEPRGRVLALLSSAKCPPTALDAAITPSQPTRTTFIGRAHIDFNGVGHANSLAHIWTGAAKQSGKPGAVPRCGMSTSPWSARCMRSDMFHNTEA